MKMITGRLENGTVRLNESASWPEGTPVLVMVDVRPMTWKEAGKIVGPAEVGVWSGMMDSWEASGTIDPLAENRCHVTVEDLLDDDYTPPTPEEAEEFARSMREVEAFNRACFEREREKDILRESHERANGTLARTKESVSHSEP